MRRQLTWLRNGALLGILPFALIYAVPYMMGVAPNQAMNLAVLSLPLIPLTWAYAILRYRLMDVDMIFQEGYVYTLATLAVLAIFYGLIFAVSSAGDLNGTTMVVLILIAAFVFQPIRNWIQEQLDRYYFYKDRYDYRRTLIEFARELGSPTDLARDARKRRRPADPHAGHPPRCVLRVGRGRGRFPSGTGQQSQRQADRARSLRPGFEFPESRAPSKPYLFFERTRNRWTWSRTRWPSGVRRSIAELELTYYLPCSARGRTIAYLGVSRTEAAIFCRARTSNCW